MSSRPDQHETACSLPSEIEPYYKVMGSSPLKLFQLRQQCSKLRLQARASEQEQTPAAAEMTYRLFDLLDEAGEYQGHIKVSNDHSMDEVWADLPRPPLNTRTVFYDRNGRMVLSQTVSTFPHGLLVEYLSNSLNRMEREMQLDCQTGTAMIKQYNRGQYWMSTLKQISLDPQAHPGEKKLISVRTGSIRNAEENIPLMREIKQGLRRAKVEKTISPLLAWGLEFPQDEWVDSSSCDEVSMAKDVTGELDVQWLLTYPMDGSNCILRRIASPATGAKTEEKLWFDPKRQPGEYKIMSPTSEGRFISLEFDSDGTVIHLRWKKDPASRPEDLELDEVRLGIKEMPVIAELADLIQPELLAKAATHKLSIRKTVRAALANTDLGNSLVFSSREVKAPEQRVIVTAEERISQLVAEAAAEPYNLQLDPAEWSLRETDSRRPEEQTTIYRAIKLAQRAINQSIYCTEESITIRADIVPPTDIREHEELMFNKKFGWLRYEIACPYGTFELQIDSSGRIINYSFNHEGTGVGSETLVGLEKMLAITQADLLTPYREAARHIFTPTTLEELGKRGVDVPATLANIIANTGNTTSLVTVSKDNP